VEFREAAQTVYGLPLPHTHTRRGRTLYNHVIRNRPGAVLELGTGRGGSAIFIAAALQANGTGHLTSVDSPRWQSHDPSADEVLEKAGLREWVTLDASYSTYTWFLKAEIEKHRGPSGTVQPVYDLIFLDGAKNWTTDGLAVVLAERLLRPGGWLLLDDLGWTHGKGGRRSHHYDVRLDKLSEEELAEPHLRAIFDLLIVTNPSFDRFRIQDDWWGWAHKSALESRHHRGGVLSGRPRPRRPPAEPAAGPPPARRMRDRVWRRLPPRARRTIRGVRDRARRR
jgi:predicted O-methyltransferase YrrM